MALIIRHLDVVLAGGRDTLVSVSYRKRHFRVRQSQLEEYTLDSVSWRKRHLRLCHLEEQRL